MELINHSLLTEDKEQVLHVLKMNNVQALEVIDDPKTCKFPVVGRKFGHHGGQDLFIVHTKEHMLNCEADYFTKLYVLEQEYMLEIEDFSVKKIKKAVVNSFKHNEIPIRTLGYGWEWVDVEDSCIPEEWLHLAIRALYTTGLHCANVKIGILTNDTPIVIDINPINRKWKGDISKEIKSFTMGADIEFMLNCENELLPASEFFPVEGPIGCDERQIEQDSGEYALGEIRPTPSESPHKLYKNIEKLLIEASEQIPYSNIEFRAGSMPFFGYQCGGHLHFGLKPSFKLVRALDYFLAIPLAIIEKPSTSRKRRKTKHGGLGRIRKKTYGFEYLSLSSWVVEPEITLAVLCLAKLVASNHNQLRTDLLFHPFIQRAYYQGNHIILKHVWKDIKNQIINLEDYSLYKEEINPLFTYIENEQTLRDQMDIRQHWGLMVPEQVYERGMLIYVPKKVRNKLNINEGEETIVFAGKSMAKAVIRPFPFSFLNPNNIQLSKPLREQLLLPKEWLPKVSSVNGALMLGPIMGILAERPFQRQGTYFQHLGKVAKHKQMLVYVFEPKDIIWEKRLIKGTTIDGEGLFPFPSVIYDRYFRIGRKQNLLLEETRAKLEFVYGIPFINSMKLFELTGNKWFSHQVLSENHQEFLPETRLLQNSEDITEMLDRYGDILLKPLGGALGNGIIRIAQTSLGIRYIHSRERNYRTLQHIDELFVQFPILKQDNAYLVQETINRKKLKDHYVELRVYMQKNGAEKWVRTGMVARMASDGVMTDDTEINKRSSIVLKKMYSNLAELREIKEQIANVTRSVVEDVEEEVGPFGELAIDICFDQYDQIKILEINAKPDNLFSQVNAYKLRVLAAIRLLNYATSLSMFQLEEIE